MGVAIPAGLAGPGSKFTANVIMFQGHPMGSLPLSPEDVTTAVGRDKGGSKKGNEKGGWEGCTDQGKEKRRKERGKKRAYVCFQNHWDFPG